MQINGENFENLRKLGSQVSAKKFDTFEKSE